MTAFTALSKQLYQKKQKLTTYMHFIHFCLQHTYTQINKLFHINQNNRKDQYHILRHNECKTLKTIQQAIKFQQQ